MATTVALAGVRRVTEQLAPVVDGPVRCEANCPSAIVAPCAGTGSVVGDVARLLSDRRRRVGGTTLVATCLRLCEGRSVRDAVEFPQRRSLREGCRACSIANCPRGIPSGDNKHLPQRLRVLA